MSRLNVTEDCTDLKTVFALMDEAFQKPDEQHHIPYLRNLLHNFLILSERILGGKAISNHCPLAWIWTI
ncbi:MAG: hypothetical protein IPN20_15040 [Haliscomenobacter sp.]|nr:hypothetical protein [Haliscomenobacter sp.]